MEYTIGQWWVQLWHNSCNTTKNLTIPFKSDFANNMTRYSWYSCVQACNIPCKVISIVFGRSYSVYSYNCEYIISIIFLVCLTMCPYLSTRTEQKSQTLAKIQFRGHIEWFWIWTNNHNDTAILIPFWLIIMWDCTALKMHLTQKMYMICTWDWQQNLTYVWYVAPSTHVNTHLLLCSTHNLLIKRYKELNLCIQVEHFNPCDRSDDISISGSEAPPTYWLSVKVSGMERWREMKSLLHSDQFS